MTQTVESFELKIQEVMKKRQQKLPEIRAKLEAWRQLQQHLNTLDDALSGLAEHSNASPELRDVVRAYRQSDAPKKIDECLAHLSRVEARIRRETINIGVSGQARVGKSTLLQKLSGLSDDQIPTGNNLEVTAVRSRLFHSATQNRAILNLHSYESFRDEVLEPYHREIEIGNAPVTIEAFRTFNYPAPQDNLSAEARAHLGHLKDFQKALPSYEADLCGSEKVVDLVGLRQFVAYPTSEEKNSENCKRRYLAVKDARIECRFPENGVTGLVLLDLPGLGGLSAGADHRHVDGLRHEVDLVLMVKRAEVGMGFYTSADAKTLNLLDDVKGAISSRRDFVMIVNNMGGLPASQVEPLVHELQENLSDYKILAWRELNGANSDVLQPALEHLSTRLAHMDAEILAAAENESRSLTASVGTALAELERGIRNNAPASQSSIEEIYRDSLNIQEGISLAFRPLLESLYANARNEECDQGYISAVQAARESLDAWLDDGLGLTREQWLKDTVGKITVNKGVIGHVEQEVNRLRVEIGNHFLRLDVYLEGIESRLLDECASIIREHTGHLLPPGNGRATLEKLRHLLAESSQPCPTLVAALDDMLQLKISYRSQFHPMVRRALDVLKTQSRDPETGTMKPLPIAASVDEQGARELLEMLTQMAKQAAYYAYKALISEGKRPALILHAACEHFDDQVIRSKESEQEFWRLGRCYRDEIWPDKYSGFEANNARIARVNRAIKDVSHTLSSLRREPV